MGTLLASASWSMDVLRNPFSCVLYIGASGLASGLLLGSPGWMAGVYEALIMCRTDHLLGGYWLHGLCIQFIYSDLQRLFTNRLRLRGRSASDHLLGGYVLVTWALYTVYIQ